MPYTLRIDLHDLKLLPQLGELQDVISTRVGDTGQVDLTTPNAQVLEHWRGALERAGRHYEERAGPVD